jgi:hypothetical protein
MQNLPVISKLNSLSSEVGLQIEEHLLSLLKLWVQKSSYHMAKIPQPVTSTNGEEFENMNWSHAKRKNQRLIVPKMQ